MTGFLIDTNVISELVKPNPEGDVVRWIASVDEELLYLSVMTIGEIRRGIERLPKASRRVRLEAWLTGELAVRFQGRILGVDESVADRWGRLMAHANERGKPLPVVDGLLAATAINHNLTLVTRDITGVSATGVAIFDPWQI